MLLKHHLLGIFLIMAIIVPVSLAQTPALLPFQVDLVEVRFPEAPALHSFAAAQFQGKWLFIGGRTNGIHSFDPLPINNFPPSQANHWVWVVDPGQSKAVSVDLYDQSITPSLGFVADALSSNNTQSFQDGDTLYIIGGYGYNRTTNLMQTFPTLTAIDVPGIIDAVESRNAANIVPHIRQVQDDRLKVTGGELEKIGENYFLVFGQRFDGLYNPADVGNDQQYTDEVRIFTIVNDCANPPCIANYTTISAPPQEPGDPQPNQFHRRDLNVLPAIRSPNGTPGINVYGGVFTTAFTPYLNPIYINSDGSTHTASVDRTFNQYMNQYDTARMVLFDSAAGNLYTVFFGGISYGVLVPDGVASVQEGAEPRVPYSDLIQVEAKSELNGFRLDPNIPFIDQTTAITLRADGTTQQCLLAQRHRFKLTPKQLLPERLGTNARIIPALNVPAFENGVIKLRSLQDPTLVGYLYGGMRTTDANPTSTGQSFASNRIFKVLVRPIPAACIAVPAVIQ